MAEQLLGYIGVGAMGGGMARSLLRAGFQVLAFNRSPARREAVVAAGGRGAESMEQVMQECDTVFTCLRSSAITVAAMDEHLLPNARKGQNVIDTGTTELHETRRLEQDFAKKGVTFIDAPVSGGSVGAEAGELHMFIGGDETTVESLKSVFAAMAKEGKAVYCGPSGAGQIMKYVNQMVLGLVEAAYLECIAYGVRGGLQLSDMYEVLGGDAIWRSEFASRIKRVMDGKGEDILIKQPEFPYFLKATEEMKFTAPILKALDAYLKDTPTDYLDNMNRPRASLWKELMERKA